MHTLRTPDDQFDRLPGYSFQPHYVELDDFEGGSLRMHYLDEGDPNGDLFLLMHGEPSWSYLYRKMVPLLVDAGYRVVAPDLIGFGRSDKPGAIEDYSYQRHIDWVTSWINQLDLRQITLICQDWGGLLGLRIAAENPDRFARILAANTMLPTGDHPPSDVFLQWRQFATTVPEFNCGGIIKGGTVTDLPDEVIAAYNAPYPDETYKAGARAFPSLVPVTPDDPASAANRQAWEVLKAWNKPFITAFSDSDPVTAGGDKIMQKLIPGTRGQAHTQIVQGGHFLQEDQGEALAQVAIEFAKNNPLP